MKKYEIIITDKAETDLKDIVHYFLTELKEPLLARKLFIKIKEEILSLEQMPNRCTLVCDERLSQKGIRKLFVDNYIIFYIINEEISQVSIIRILYSKRDWINLL